MDRNEYNYKSSVLKNAFVNLVTISAVSCEAEFSNMYSRGIMKVRNRTGILYCTYRAITWPIRVPACEFGTGDKTA